MGIKKSLSKVIAGTALALSIYACGGKENGQISEYTNSNAMSIISKPTTLEIMVKDNWEYDFVIVPDNNIEYSLKNNPPNMVIDNVGSIKLISDYEDLGRYWITVTAKNDESLVQQVFPFEVKYPYMPFSTPLEYDLIKGSNDIIAICETPCSLPEDYFNKKFEGMLLGISELYKLTGIKPIDSLLPVEVHLQFDSECHPECKDKPESLECREIGGSSFLYRGGERGLICIYNTQSGLDPTSLEDQTSIIHEMIHALFIRRISMTPIEEPFAYAISNLITGFMGRVPEAVSFSRREFNKFPFKFVYDLNKYSEFDVEDLPSFYSKILGKREETGCDLITLEIKEILDVITGYETMPAFTDNSIDPYYVPFPPYCD